MRNFNFSRLRPCPHWCVIKNLRFVSLKIHGFASIPAEVLTLVATVDEHKYLVINFCPKLFPDECTILLPLANAQTRHTGVTMTTAFQYNLRSFLSTLKRQTYIIFAKFPRVEGVFESYCYCHDRWCVTKAKTHAFWNGSWCGQGMGILDFLEKHEIQEWVWIWNC